MDEHQATPGGSRVAVVTGAGRKGGIGAASARQLLEAGFRVVISDLGRPLREHPGYASTPDSELQQTAKDLAALGEVVAVPCDVTQEDEVAALYEAALDAFGRLDVSIQAAGLAIGLTEIIDLDPRDWRINLDVMATGTFLCSAEAARRMIHAGNGGSLINILSQASKTGQPLLGAYTAAKFAALGLTQVMAHELGPYGIRVNGVCPGTVATPLLEVEGGVFDAYPRHFDIDPERYKRSLKRKIPLGRFAEPEDIAGVVAFLASPASEYITGETINVTGGQEMH